MTLFLTILFWMSVITFILYALDKHLAVYQRRRIPEFVLLMCSFLVGAFGGLMAMCFFRHKTRHASFLILNPLFLLLQIGVAVLLALHLLPF